jgi:hypothetical protein
MDKSTEAPNNALRIDDRQYIALASMLTNVLSGEDAKGRHIAAIREHLDIDDSFAGEAGDGPQPPLWVNHAGNARRGFEGALDQIRKEDHGPADPLQQFVDASEAGTRNSPTWDYSSPPADRARMGGGLVLAALGVFREMRDCNCALLQVPFREPIASIAG